MVTVFEHNEQRFKQEVNGVFTYVVDGLGKLKALRGYWELEAALKTIVPVES